jgi:phage terminase large subunit-like protein
VLSSVPPPTTLPSPLRWQRKALRRDREVRPRLTACAVGRRSGKSHYGLLWLMLAPGGLRDGMTVVWGAPDFPQLSEIRDVFRHWFSALITGRSPDGTGFVLCNGGKIDFASLAPGHDAFRGKGYSLAVLDECAIIRNLTATIEQNLMPALSQYAGRLLLMSTPKGFDEFHDWFRRAEREGLVITGSSALNEHLPPGEIEEERRTLPPLVYESEIEGRFVVLEGACLKKSEIRYGVVPDRSELVYVSFGLDLAISEKKSADYSALCVAAVDTKGRRWVAMLAMWRSRWSETVSRLLNYVAAWSPDVIILESTAMEGGVADATLREYGLPIRSIKPFADKKARFQVHAGRYLRGEIFHSDRLDPECEGQCLAYPQVRHDDVFDALTYGLAGLDSKALGLLSGSMSAGKRSGFAFSGLVHERRAKIIWNGDGTGYAHGVEGGLVKYNSDGSIDEGFH